MPLPARLVYLTSGLESVGRVNLDDLQWERRAWNGMQAYSDSKLYDVLLAFAIARRYPWLRSNAVDPGWIKTKLGGHGATDELPVGARTQVWLAASDDSDAAVTGRYFKWQAELRANPDAYDTHLQEALLAACATLVGIALPGSPSRPPASPPGGGRSSARLAGWAYAVPATPMRLPSGSVKWPTTRPVGARSGPIGVCRPGARLRPGRPRRWARRHRRGRGPGSRHLRRCRPGCPSRRGS